MPVCAYCQKERPATREHVIPSFLYALQKTAEGKIIGWNEVIEKMVGGEAKVRDVCAECNSGVLSELDSYGKGMLSQAGLLVHNYLGRSLTLPLDHSQLLRWLLKISFNSSRTDGAHSYLFEEFVPFILGESDPPPRHRVALLGYLASPVALDADQIAAEPFKTAARGAQTLNPLLVRICYGVVPGEQSFILRINVLGPLVFFLPIFKPNTLPGHAAAAIRRLQKFHPGAVELTSKKRLVHLQAGSRTWIDLYAHQVQRTRDIANRA